MVKITSIIFFVTIVILYCCSRTALATPVDTTEPSELTLTEQPLTVDLLAVDEAVSFDDQLSPLLMPKESLQKKEYFDFLSTLYRHDKTKAGLFADVEASTQKAERRKKRTIIFRPLFVYRNQVVRRKKAKRRY